MKRAVLRKSMKNMKGIKIWSATCALLLAVSCLATMVFIGAADTSVGTVTAQSEYVCRIAADDMTNTPPYASAGVTGGFGSEESNGRVWVDKSVSANDASNAFDVTLSALAQEYSYSEEAIKTIMEQNAADVLFVLDFSSSMTQSMDGSTRIKVLASSLNDAMKKIMDANPNNRIMAVAFDAGSYDFLPLGSYGPNSSGNYVEYDSSTKGIKMCSGATKDGAAATYALPLGSGTHMQIGITYGCNALIQSMNDGYGEGSKRMPFVMVMTDGSSNYSNDNWAGYNLPNQNNQSNQIEANSTLAATFWKKRLIDAYNTKNTANGFDSPVNAVWFNIGVGLGDPGDDANTAKRDQVSMKPQFASPDATSGSVARTIYNNILTRLEKAYNTPEYYIGDAMNGYDDILARAGVDISELREAVAEATAQAIESTAIQAAALETSIRQAGDRDTYTSDNDWYAAVKTTFGIDHGSKTYKNDKNDKQYKKDVAAAVEKKVQNDVNALVQGAIDEAVENAVSRVTFDNPDLVTNMNKAVSDYFNEFVRDYMGYDGATQAERQSNYEKNPMHGFAEYVNYADTAAKVEGSFDDLASLIAAATQSTVIPITHHATSGAAADEIFITFTDPLGKGTELKTDEDGNYVMSIVLNGVTYQGRPKSGAAAGTYEFYNSDKVLNSTAIISDGSVKWEINAYELPIIRFANRMLPGQPVDGKIYEDPNLVPISVKYEVVPTADALANTATNGNFIYEHDNKADAPAKAVFTPTLANTYYFDNNGTLADPDYEKITTAIETTVNKGTNANKSDTAAYVTKSAWGTGDDADDFIILLGNDARTKVLAEVSIEDDRMEDDGDVIAHTYGTDETITYTLKVKNLSDEKLEKLTYTLDVTPSGPAATDTPSALTVGTCSTTPAGTTKTGNKQTLTFTLAELAAGATETVTVPMTPAAGTKDGTTVDAVVTLTKVFGADLVTPATDEVGEVLVAEDVTVYTYLDGTKTNLTGITGAPSTLYIKKAGGNYIALTKDTATATYVATNIPLGEYTIYDGNSGTPKALGKVSVVKDGDNIGNVYWKTLTLTKAWDDANDRDGKRPTGVTFTLYKDSIATANKVADYSLTKANSWKATATVLAKDATGADITYVLDEAAVTDYPSDAKTVDNTKFTITNKHVPETASVTLTKKWADGSNQDGKRPTSITLTLYKQIEGGTKTKVDDYTFNGTGNDWTKTIDNLPKYEGGKLITYTVDEATVPTGYTKTVDGLTVTNKHTPEVVSATLKKVWDDNQDQDGKRPTSITLTLYKQIEGGTKTKVDDYTFIGIGNEWTKTIDNLPKYESGKLITYTADEATVPTDYTKSATGLTVTNKHTPKIKTISGTKTWDDADYVGKTGYTRPNITVNLTATVDGLKVDALCKTTTATAAGDWKYAFYDVPVYHGGKAVTYTVSEAAVDGFTPTVTGDDIKNTPIDKAEVLKPISFKVKKVDSLTSTGKGLKGAVFTLTDEGGASTTYTTLDDGTVEIPFTATGTFTLAETTAPTGYQLNAANTYTVTVSKNFTKVELNTNKTKWNWNYDLAYTLSDVQDGVLTVKDAPIATEKTTLTKAWDDNKNQDGVRPTSVTFGLYKTVNSVTTKVQDVTLSGEMTAESWTKVIENLPTYEDGYAVTYTIDEEVAGLGDDYSKKSVDNDTLTITNSHKPSVTSATLKKVWDDNQDQDGKRPDDVTLTLYKTVNGVTTKVDDYTFDGTGNEWTKKVEDLPKFEGGYAVTYTADELEANLPTGYTKSADGLTVTNSHTPEVTDVTVKKVWVDENDADNVRPEDVTLTLYKTVDGTKTKVQDVTFDGTGNEWTKTIEGLPVYENGFEITYTVDEVTNNVPEGYAASADGLTVTNTRDVKRDITITVENGESDKGDKATVTYGEDETITFTATEGYALDTVTVDGETAVLTDGKYAFTDVTKDHEIIVKYAEDKNGDGIPDKYQATVTYKVVNGTWADGDAEAISALFDMKEYVDGVWNELNPTLGDTVPTGMVPDDTHIVPGAWDKTCDGDVAVVDGDVFTYTFDKNLTHTITVIVEGGTSDVGDKATVIHKDDQTITFTPDEGKVILSVVIDGEEVKITDDLTYTFNNVTEDHEIKVTFADDKNGNGVPDIFEAQVTYQIENGTWADGTTDEIVENFVLKELKDGVWIDTGVTLGDTIPTGMTPTEYYTDNGKWNTKITADTAVTTNATYRYTFGDEKTHTVTIDIENGTSDPNQGTFPVKHKEDQDVKITPNDHYVIDKIIVDGEEVEIPEDGTLHFTEIVTDHDIQVICEKDANDDMIADKYQATVTVDMDNEEAGSVSGDGVYWKGETATVTATPSTGYRFIGWELDGEIVSYDPEYTFTADENVRLIALFEKEETPTEAPTTKPTTEPTLPPEAPKTGDALPSAALLLAVAAAGVLFASRKREE